MVKDKRVVSEHVTISTGSTERTFEAGTPVCDVDQKMVAALETAGLLTNPKAAPKEKGTENGDDQ